MRRTLQIILKIAERCNLNCSYCYYFNMDDATPGARPALMDARSVEGAAEFLEACLAGDAYDQAIVILHGGEPMLMPAARARAVLSRLSDVGSPDKPVFFGMQTNGTLVNAEWLDLIEAFRISVGVSLDGDARAHDLYRVDKQDRPTHAKVEKGVRDLSAFAASKGLAPVTLLTVAGASEDGSRVYTYFTDALGAQYVDFLLPDATHDISDPDVQERAERFLERAFARWLADQTRPAVGHFQQYVDRFLALKRDGVETPDRCEPSAAPNIFTIYSDGRVTGNDYVRSMLVSSDAELPRVTDPLDVIFSHVRALEGLDASDPPAACRSCRWVNACGGGEMLHRFSNAKGFNNPSVYCSHIKRMYAAVEAAFNAEMSES